MPELAIKIDSDCENGYVVHVWIPRQGWQRIRIFSIHKKYVAKTKEELVSILAETADFIIGE
jgi:hypothetical protein